MSLISRHIFVKKNPVVVGAKFFLASLGISRDTHQICVVRSGKVREKCREKVRESQGIQIELTSGNPGHGLDRPKLVDIHRTVLKNHWRTFPKDIQSWRYFLSSTSFVTCLYAWCTHTRLNYIYA